MHLLEPVSRRAFTQFTSTGLSKHSSSRLFFPKLYSCGLLTMHPGGPRLRLLTGECGKRVGRRRDPPRITQEASCPPCFQEPRPGNIRLDGCHRHVDAERPVRGPVDRPAGQPGPGGVVNAPTSPQAPRSPILGPGLSSRRRARFAPRSDTLSGDARRIVRGRLRQRALAASDAADFSQRIRAQIVMP